MAGNVWIKLANFSTSIRSDKFVLKIKNRAIGTPGFIAPEVYQRIGTEVDASKVYIIIQFQFCYVQL